MPRRGAASGRERELADHVGRGQHRGGDEDQHDRVAPPLLQELRIDQADLAQQGQDHRQLERDAEGEDQRHDEREILVHLRQKLDRGLAGLADLLQADRELDQQRHRQEIDDEGAEQEEDRRGDEVGQEGPALVAVEARRHEGVELGRDHREGQEAGAEHAQLDVGEDLLEEVGRDQPRLVGPDHAHVGIDQHVVDVLREEEADKEHHPESEHRLDQPRTQLDQVLDQGCARGLDLGFIGLGHHALRPVLAVS